jgi:hypothetical protein
MTPIPLTLPKGAAVFGEILNSYAECPRRLSQDIMQVRLANGVGIDVGWLPGYDPAGRFVISVYEGDFDNQLIDPIDAATPSDAALTVQRLAHEYSDPRPVRKNMPRLRR